MLRDCLEDETLPALSDLATSVKAVVSTFNGGEDIVQPYDYILNRCPRKFGNIPYVLQETHSTDGAKSCTVIWYPRVFWTRKQSGYLWEIETY